MSWSTVLVACFIASQAVCMAMLVTSGMYSELFGRHRRVARAAAQSQAIRGASNEWVENHEFWEITDLEEVAF